LTRYLSLAEYVWLAEQVTGIEAAVVAKVARLDLADSALHAPAAGFGDEDFYPDLLDKAAVLTCRLAWNHPLRDGNKRAAWAALVVFLDLGVAAAGRIRRAAYSRPTTVGAPTHYLAEIPTAECVGV
jgi:death-on-curing protein